MTAETADQVSPGEASFQLLADHMPDIIILAFDEQLEIWAATGAALRSRGWRPGQFLGRRVPEVGRPDDAAITETFCPAALSGAVHRFETTGNLDPSRLWAMQFVPLPAAQGRIGGGMLIARDVTEQRHAEQQLLASRRQLAEAQRIAQVGSWEWNLETDELVVSDELRRLFGLPLDRKLTMTEGVAEAIHPADLEQVAAHLGRLHDDPSPFALEHRIIRTDGDVRTVLARGEGWSTRTGGWCGSSAPTRTSPTAAGPTPSAAACSTGSTRPRRARTAAWPPTSTTATSRAWPRSASSSSRPGCGSGPAARPRSTSCSGRSPRTCRPRRPPCAAPSAASAPWSWSRTAWRRPCARRPSRPATGPPWPAARSSPSWTGASTQWSRRPCSGSPTQALANVVEHASATHAEVAIECTAKGVLLRVSDDGCGFDPDHVQVIADIAPFGLIAMRERVEALGGRFRVTTAPGRGTVVEARLPLTVNGEGPGT